MGPGRAHPGAPGREDPALKRRPRQFVAAESSAPWGSRFVLDASVAVKLYVKEPGSDLADRLAERVASREAVLLAPELVRVELAGALLRVRGPDWRSVQADLTRFELLGVELHPLTRELVSSAVRIAGDHHLRIADAVYAALAERSGCAVVSADAEFVRRLAGTGLAVSLSSLR